MTIKRSFFLSLVLVLLLLPTGLPPNGKFVSMVQAQSTGDTLRVPTKTATPRPTATSRAIASPQPTATPVARQVWVGRLVSNTLGVTEGTGSIFRVSVDGLLDTPIELRSGGQVIAGKSGTKPEYGPYAAEFAPVTKGFWTVSVPAIGASLQVEADNYNLAVIEFSQVPLVEVTDTAAGSPSPTPVRGTTWIGRLTNESSGAGVPFARLLVTVAGRDGQPVQISTISQILNTAYTGQKPDELGPNTVEFTGLTPGTYFLEPLGLGASLAVELKPNVETRVIFEPLPPTVTPVLPPTALPTQSPLPVFTAAPPTMTATPSPTATDTPLPPPTPTDTPLPSPTPVTRWLGAVEAREPAAQSLLTVKVAGLEGIAVQLTRTDDDQFQERRCVTGQGGYGQDSCAFAELPPGWYLVAPEGIGVNLPLFLNGSETAQVAFDVEVLPSGITGWQAQVHQNTNGVLARPRTEAAIRVTVAGRAGQVVALRSVRLGTTKYRETAYNPVLGTMMCEFGQLGPGVYQLEALHTGARQSIFVDGEGLAEIEFSPSATYAIQAAQLASAQVGRGALPRQPTATATVAPTATSPPSFVVPHTLPTATTTPSPTATFTPTPAFAWQGRVVDTTVTGAGALGVRAVGLKDHPVIIRSGGWQSSAQLTGEKPELGDYATEFGGLAQGEYIVELVDLAELKVMVGSGEFVLVEFRYDFVTSP